MRLSSKLFVASAVLVASLAGNFIQAGVILQATDATTDMGFGNFGSLNNIRNQSGLSTGYTSGVTDFDTYIAGNPTHNGGGTSTIWDSNNYTTTGHIDFDLGGSFSIESFALWN